MAWLICLLLVTVARTQAQDVVVIERSEQDHQAAEKLAELISEPLRRVSSTADDASACDGGARIALIFDAAEHEVRLVRCRDGTILTRSVDLEAARATPYLAAFVATELMTVNRELENVRVEPVPVRTPSAASEAAGAPDERSSSWLLRIRAGAEMIALGDPFGGTLRPTLAAGVSFTPASRALAWLVELQISVLGSTELRDEAERLSLGRSDGRLRAGLLYPIGALSLAGLLHVRSSLTQAEYGASGGSSNTSLRLGFGAGLEADLKLIAWLSLYAEAIFDLATSRSDYRVRDETWVRDPAFVLSCSLGLLMRGRL